MTEKEVGMCDFTVTLAFVIVVCETGIKEGSETYPDFSVFSRIIVLIESAED